MQKKKEIDRILLFYNPHAGNGVFSANLDKVIEAFQRKKCVVMPLRADRKDLLERFFASVDVNTFKKVVAAGGDGTINAIVSMMIKYDVNVPLAIFPSGTANDLAHYFDLPTDISEMLEIALNENYTWADVGMAGERCFVNVLAMGMMVDVSQKTDPNIKNTLGIMAYYLRGMAEIPKLKPIPVKLSLPDQVIDTKMYAMLVMNGRSAGGFKRAAPEAAINDGLFDVILFQSVHIGKLMPLIFSVLTGEHTENENIVFLRTDQIRIESPEEISTDVDGETGPPLPLDVRILHKRLQINTLKADMEGNVW